MTTHERDALWAAAADYGYDISPPPAYIHAWQAARAYVPPQAEAEGLEVGMTTCNCGAYGVVHEQGADDCLFVPGEARR